MNRTEAVQDVPVAAPVITLAATGEHAGLSEIIATLHELRDAALANEGASLDFQRTLHWLHYGGHEPSHALRQWLASQVYDYFEARAVPVELDEVLDAPALVQMLHAAQEKWSPLVHPLFIRIYGEAPRAEFEVYLRHKWIIMLTFWRSLAEYGNRLQRRDLKNTALVYKNVNEELGEGDAHDSHLAAHLRLLRHLGIDARWNDQPSYAETYEYINFRMFCMRHADPSWGAGSFFSQEATSLEYTLGHYRRLRDFGVSHEHCAIYYEHDEIDTEHTAEIESIIVDLAQSREQQATVLRALCHQMRLWHRHFDRVLEEIEQL